MGVLYIAGYKPGAGSTALASALATVWRKAGRKVALAKPLALEDGEADAQLLASVSGAGPSGSPVTIGKTVTGDHVSSAAKRVEAMAKDAEVVIVEGLPLTSADGSAVAGSADLAKRLNARVIGVLPYARNLGQADASVWRQTYGDALAGVVVNRRTRYAEHDAPARLAPELAAAGVPTLGVLGEDRLMLAPTVQQMVDHLGGSYVLGETNGNQLVEHILIGALITEWGGNYFGRYPNQAVIARCGRTDLQMSALNFPLNALFLSGGCSAPPQYVYQRADYLEVPLVLLRQTTQEAIEALGTLHGDVHHRAKVERFAALAEQALDWDRVAAAAGL